MRKKTYEEHVAAGTLRLDKMKSAKLHTVREMPKPEKGLSKRAVRVYKEICSHLIKHDSLCEVDSFYISGIAKAYDTYMELNDLIEKKEAEEKWSGLFMRHKGGSQYSAEWSMKEAEWKKFCDGCVKLGLHIQARDKIAAFAKDDDGSENDEDELNLN